MHKKYSVPEKVSVLLLYNTQLISIQELADLIDVESKTIRNWDQEMGKQMFTFNDVSKAIISSWSDKPVGALLILLRISKVVSEETDSL